MFLVDNNKNALIYDLHKNYSLCKNQQRVLTIEDIIIKFILSFYEFWDVQLADYTDTKEPCYKCPLFDLLISLFE